MDRQGCAPIDSSRAGSRPARRQKFPIEKNPPCGGADVEQKAQARNGSTNWPRPDAAPISAVDKSAPSRRTTARDADPGREAQQRASCDTSRHSVSSHLALQGQCHISHGRSGGRLCMRPGIDHIIVGAAGGLHCRKPLSADRSCRMLLLEAGGADRNIWLKLHRLLRTIYNQRFSRCGRAERNPARRCLYVAAPRRIIVDQRPIFIRGQHEGLTTGAPGAKGWGYRDLLPISAATTYQGATASITAGSANSRFRASLRNRASAAGGSRRGVRLPRKRTQRRHHARRRKLSARHRQRWHQLGVSLSHPIRHQRSVLRAQVSKVHLPALCAGQGSNGSRTGCSVRAPNGKVCCRPGALRRRNCCNYRASVGRSAAPTWHSRCCRRAGGQPQSRIIIRRAPSSDSNTPFR